MSQYFRSLAAALGSLCAAIPSLLRAFGMDELAAYRVLIWAYAAIALTLLLMYRRLSPDVEVIQATGPAFVTRIFQRARTGGMEIFTPERNVFNPVTPG